MAWTTNAHADSTNRDARLAPPRKVSEGNHFRAFTDRTAWEARARWVREQTLVAAGLWPLPERCPLNPVVTKTIDRGDYVIENVYFTSLPGFYLTGTLFRPKGPGPFPGVLNTHGHARNGRHHDAGAKAADRFPYQARCASLAKLGCVAFLYDMVGYADSQQLRHPTDAPKSRVPDGVDDLEGLECELHGVSTLGLQTWNSIRALDYLASRPDVDPRRLACTGESGGATQTLLLMMADPRLAAAAPVCMVSPGFQGDCTCEQAALAKVGTDTVEYCAAFAPKPLLILCATGDWTKDLPEDGGPEIRATYTLMGASNNLEIVRHNAPHNYNRMSRETMYNWLNRTFGLGHSEPILEPPLDPIDVKELAVFDATHPRPADALDATGLRAFLFRSAQNRLERLKAMPASEEFQTILNVALRHMIADDLPNAVEARITAETLGASHREQQLILSRHEAGEQVVACLKEPAQKAKRAVVIVQPVTTSHSLADALVAAGEAALMVQPFLTGPAAPAAPPATTGFFPCFNRTLLANRVHDILTGITFLRHRTGLNSVDLVGVGEAGPWCLLAQGLCGNAVGRLFADHAAFSFQSVRTVSDPMYLPGALRYGDLITFAGLGTASELFLSGAQGLDASWLKSAYAAAPDALRIDLESASQPILLRWLTRP